MSDVYTLDLVLFCVVLISAIVAYLRGFVREFFVLVSWAGAFVITYLCFEPASRYLGEVWQPGLVAQIVATVGIFAAVVVLLSLGSRVVAGRMAGSQVGALDRSLGFLFGIARGALIICFVYLVASRIVPPDEQPGWLKDARSTPLIVAGSRLIVGLLPNDVAGYGLSADDMEKQELEKALEDKRLYDRLERPEPKTADTPPEPEEGYREGERRDLDRLIQGTQ